MDNNQQSKAIEPTGKVPVPMPSHTPLPWRIFTTEDGRKLVGIGGLDGEGILDAGFGVWAWNDAEGIANAELVVRAVNSHADMLAALRAVCDLSLDVSQTQETRLNDMYDAAAAAIAKAEGR